jgi:uncharacterized protein with GYD domain
MPTYISLVNLTDQGVRDAKNIKRRVDETYKLFESFGVRFRDLYLVTGAYDYIAVVEAPDDKTAAKAVLSLGSRGNVRTQTLRAFTSDEIEGIVNDLR